jgi:hypothetical protein
MNKRRRNLMSSKAIAGLLGSTIVLVVSVLLAAPVQAVPTTINISGNLEDSSGDPVTGTYAWRVRSQEAATGGNQLGGAMPSAYATDAELSTGLAGKSDTGHGHNLQDLSAAAAAEQATAAKDEALQALADDMKADLRYAENTVNYDDDQLKLIG